MSNEDPMDVCKAELWISSGRPMEI